jgi:hypothetical protein
MIMGCNFQVIVKNLEKVHKLNEVAQDYRGQFSL